MNPLSNFDEVTKFRFTLMSESDRGCALMAASYLDEKLAELLISRFTDDKSSRELVAQSGPLGSFSNRIDIAYALGYLSKDTRRDLHLIRRIRNDFAHSSARLDFTDSALASRCSNLMHNYREDGAGPKTVFCSVVLVMASAINFAILNSKHTTPAEEISPPEDTLRELKDWLVKLKQEPMKSEDMANYLVAMRELLRQELVKKGVIPPTDEPDESSGG